MNAVPIHRLPGTLISALLVAGVLCACNSTPEPTTTPNVIPPVSSTLPAPAEGDTPPAPVIAKKRNTNNMSCDSSKAEWTVGKIADDALLAKAKADSGAAKARILRPGQMTTMEYLAERLNLRVDEKGKVLDVNCG